MIEDTDVMPLSLSPRSESPAIDATNWTTHPPRDFPTAVPGFAEFSSATFRNMLEMYRYQQVCGHRAEQLGIFSNRGRS